ncbi:ClbS/DfsB family four-helix bundle protein [Patescibacteria group bacterium]|nr:ClbS/DfsB family four-helix bundle protein [Patescibacteria group bacterium]
MNILTFFKNLKESDWDMLVTKKWRVKDVLSHLVGWEREVAQELVKVFATGNGPWFMLTDNYAEFNQKIYQEFKNYSPETLLSELEKWQDELEKSIQEIGEDKIRRQPHTDWVFDEGDEPHFEHHIKQIKVVLIQKDRKSKLRKKFKASNKDLKRYVLSTNQDYEILEMIYKLEDKKLLAQDKRLVQLIRTQLEDDWRAPLQKILGTLFKKYHGK